MTKREALEYATEHLRSVAYSGQPAKFGFWTPDASKEINVITHGGVDLDDREASDIWMEISEQDAKLLVERSKDSAVHWDIARSICVNNLLRKKPLPRSLTEFTVCQLIGEWPRPRATEVYNLAKRNVILSAIIYEVWLLFDVSETKALKIVREAAYAANFQAPADLTDLWRKSYVKLQGLPNRTEKQKHLVAISAADRLETFLKLLPGETTQ